MHTVIPYKVTNSRDWQVDSVLSSPGMYIPVHTQPSEAVTVLIVQSWEASVNVNLVSVCVYECVYVCVHVCMIVYMCVCVYVCVCTCVYE